MSLALRNIILTLLTGLLILGCDNKKDEESLPEAPPAPLYRGKIVALGDSLTAGLGVEMEESYPFLLQQKLEENGFSYRVVNAGVSGETSSGTLSRLDWILSQNPDIVILEIGANDGLRGIVSSLIAENVDKILQKLEEKGVVTVLAGMKMVWNLGEDYTDEFNALYPRLAKKHDLLFMPFFLKDVAAVPELNRDDGIHPNAKGYGRIVENIYPYVLQAIELSEQD